MQTQQQSLVYSEFSDELRVEGVFCKGYGIIPKYVMLDKDLTIESKAIYAYFCSYSGAGNCAFPGRDKILADLNMSKDTYYKHYNLLLDQGYIVVRQERSQGNQFMKNIYTLVGSPAKFLSAQPEPERDSSRVSIAAGGMKSTGYGQIPKALMTDQRLSVKSKGLYAYYAAFTGSGKSAFPEKAVAMAHLQIGIHVFEKLNRELLSFNYIQVIQRHVNGRLSVNDVYLVDRPDGENASTDHIIRKSEVEIQSSRIQDTEQRTDDQCSKKQDTEILVTERQDTAISDNNKNKLQNQQYLKENSLINRDENDRKILTRFYQQKEYLRTLSGQNIQRKRYSPSQQQLHEEMIIRMFSQGSMAILEAPNREYIKAAVEILTEDDLLGNKKTYLNIKNGEESYRTFCIYRDTLIDLLSMEKSLLIDGSRRTKEAVYQALLPYIKIDRAQLQIELIDLYDEIFSNYRFASENHTIHRPKEYMRTCIWRVCNAGKQGRGDEEEKEVKLHIGNR